MINKPVVARAFEIAESGAADSVRGLRKKLQCEGYTAADLWELCLPVLSKQLSMRIKAASPGAGATSRANPHP